MLRKGLAMLRGRITEIKPYLENFLLLCIGICGIATLVLALVDVILLFVYIIVS